MSKGKYTVVDSEGIERTYYGCATVNEACLLGNVSPNNVTKNANQLLTFQDCFENPEYGVTVRENSVISYSVELAVAYEDLIPYEEYGILPKVSSLKLGVLSISPITNNIVEWACQPAEGNTDNCFTLKLVDPSGDFALPILDIFEQGLYSGRIDISILPRTIHMPGVVYTYNIPGLDIVLCNFIEDNFDSQSLVIRKISLTNMYEGSDAGTSTDFINQDVPEFAMTSNYESIVASSGSQKLCAFTRGMSPHQASLQNKYSDWLVLTLANFMLMFGHEIKTREFDTLASTIEVEFFYVDSKNVKQVKTLNINVWFKAGSQIGEYTPPVLPDADLDSELLYPEKSILYTTSDNKEIAEYTDELAQKFGNNELVISHGYKLLSNGQYLGWITYENIPTVIGFMLTYGNFIFQNNNKLTSVIIPEGVKTISYNSFCDCTSLHTCLFPSTLQAVSSNAFKNTAIRQLDFSHLTSSELELGEAAFKDCKQLTCITVSPHRTVVLNEAFENCINLVQVEFSQDKGQIFPIGTRCFALCVNLKTNILKYTDGEYTYLGAEAFCDCVNLKGITLKGFVSRYINCDDPTVLFNLIPFYAAWHITAGIISAVIEGRESYAFKNCTSLESVYIEPSDLLEDRVEVSVVGAGFAQGTFLNCINVKELYCNSIKPPYLGGKNIWKKGAINPKTCKLYVPVGRKHAYNSKAQWGDFPLENIIEYTPEQFEAVKQQLQEEQ